MLLMKDIEIVLLAKWSGEKLGVPVLSGKPILEDIHTVTLFISPDNQKDYYDYIINVIKPERIIFNFKTENPEFAELADESGIEVIEDCTKLMLRFDDF